MAFVEEYFAFITFGDSRKKETTVTFGITKATGDAYITEPTQILKDGTALGQLFLSFEDLTAATLKGKGVKLMGFDDAVGYPSPDANVYNFDKLMVSYVAAGNNYNLSIPSRDDAVYLVASDGVTVLLDNPSQVEDFVTRFNAIVLSKYRDAGTVTEITVAS